MISKASSCELKCCEKCEKKVLLSEWLTNWLSAVIARVAKYFKSGSEELRRVIIEFNKDKARRGWEWQVYAGEEEVVVAEGGGYTN